jgi:hypothetical protein
MSIFSRRNYIMSSTAIVNRGTQPIDSPNTPPSLPKGSREYERLANNTLKEHANNAIYEVRQAVDDNPNHGSLFTAIESVNKIIFSDSFSILSEDQKKLLFRLVAGLADLRDVDRNSTKFRAEIVGSIAPGILALEAIKKENTNSAVTSA